MNATQASQIPSDSEFGCGGSNKNQALLFSMYFVTFLE
jgi:hypothetical protein